MERKSMNQANVTKEAKKISKGLACFIVIGVAGLWFPGGEAEADLPEIPICINSGNQWHTNISRDGRIAVYTDSRNGYSSTEGTGWDIYASRIDTQSGIVIEEFPICTALKRQNHPALSGDGNIVVWQDDRPDGSIYGYVIDLEKEFIVSSYLATQDRPHISDNGRIIAWEDMRNGNRDIYAAEIDPNTGTILREFPVCIEPSDQYYPVLSEDGDIVVWTDRRRNHQGDIYGYKISTGEEFPICTHPDHQSGPNISGDTIVWSDYRNSEEQDPNENVDIYGARIDPNTLTVLEEFPICTANKNQGGAVVSKNLVIWTDYRDDIENPFRGRTSVSDIYGFDLDSSREFEVCVNPYTSKGSPCISNRWVVWSDGRGGYFSGENKNSDVYMTKIQETIISYSPFDFNKDEIINWKDFSELAIWWMDNYNHLIISPETPEGSPGDAPHPRG